MFNNKIFRAKGKKNAPQEPNPKAFNGIDFYPFCTETHLNCRVHDRCLKIPTVPLAICKMVLPLSNFYSHTHPTNFFAMFSTFNKKKDDRPASGQDKKNSALDALESELNVLNKSDLSKVEGGKETKKTFTDNSGSLRDSIGGTIPL
ncbi:MAG: hypothetical protein ACKVUS_22540 [Saprospiraceae bacterium]